MAEFLEDDADLGQAAVLGEFGQRDAVPSDYAGAGRVEAGMLTGAGRDGDPCTRARGMPLGQDRVLRRGPADPCRNLNSYLTGDDLGDEACRWDDLLTSNLNPAVRRPPSLRFR